MEKKKGMNGLLIVDKPEGITSLDVVREIKHRLGVKKAGHIGTLDPFATGVLPVVINEGTKLVPFLRESPKEYEVTLKLGEETTTDDKTGQVVMKQPWEGIQREKIEAFLRTFLGKIRQTPPMFSAIKMQGKPQKRDRSRTKRKGNRNLQNPNEGDGTSPYPFRRLLLERNLHPYSGKRFGKKDRLWGSSSLFEKDPERYFYA